MATVRVTPSVCSFPCTLFPIPHSVGCHNRADTEAGRPLRDWASATFTCYNCYRNGNTVEATPVKKAPAPRSRPPAPARTQRTPRVNADGSIAGTPGPQPAQRSVPKTGNPFPVLLPPLPDPNQYSAPRNLYTPDGYVPSASTSSSWPAGAPGPHMYTPGGIGSVPLVPVNNPYSPGNIQLHHAQYSHPSSSSSHQQQQGTFPSPVRYGAGPPPPAPQAYSMPNHPSPVAHTAHQLPHPPTQSPNSSQQYGTSFGSGSSSSYAPPQILSIPAAPQSPTAAYNQVHNRSSLTLNGGPHNHAPQPYPSQSHALQSHNPYLNQPQSYPHIGSSPSLNLPINGQYPPNIPNANPVVSPTWNQARQPSQQPPLGLNSEQFSNGQAGTHSVYTNGQFGQPASQMDANYSYAQPVQSQQYPSPGPSQSAYQANAMGYPRSSSVLSAGGGYSSSPAPGATAVHSPHIPDMNHQIQHASQSPLPRPTSSLQGGSGASSSPAPPTTNYASPSTSNGASPYPASHPYSVGATLLTGPDGGPDPNIPFVDVPFGGGRVPGWNKYAHMPGHSLNNPAPSTPPVIPSEPRPRKHVARPPRPPVEPLGPNQHFSGSFSINSPVMPEGVTPAPSGDATAVEKQQLYQPPPTKPRYSGGPPPNGESSRGLTGLDALSAIAEAQAPLPRSSSTSS